jgi:hypothetical protein
VTDNKGNKPESVSEGISYWEQTVEYLLTFRPELADPEKLRLFEDVLRRRIAVQASNGELAAKQARLEHSRKEIQRARRFTTFATTLTGGVLASIITAEVFPHAAAYTLVGVGLIGLVASKYIVSGLNRWTDSSQPSHPRPLM